jgi:hypothetical protein
MGSEIHMNVQIYSLFLSIFLGLTVSSGAVEYRKEPTKALNISGPWAAEIKKFQETHGYIAFAWPIDAQTVLMVRAPQDFSLTHHEAQHGMYKFLFEPKRHDKTLEKQKDRFPNLKSSYPDSGKLRVMELDASFSLEQFQASVGMDEVYNRLLRKELKKAQSQGKSVKEFNAKLKIEKIPSSDSMSKAMLYFLDNSFHDLTGRREIIGVKIIQSPKNLWQIEYRIPYVNEDDKFNPKNFEKLKADILKTLDQNQVAAR